MKIELRDQAIQLRREGWSYRIIQERLGVAKSTLSNWLQLVPYTANAEVRKRIQEGPAVSGERRHAKKMGQIAELMSSAKVELGELSKRDIFLLGIGLYMGEGDKMYDSVAFANSNPHIVKVMMRWFRDVCMVPDENFRLTLHIYPDTPEDEAKAFWLNITTLSSQQYNKTQIDRRENKSRKKRRMLPYGTLRIMVKSCGNPELGVVLHRRILGWIAATT